MPESQKEPRTQIEDKEAPHRFYLRSVSNKLFVWVVLTTLSALLVMGILMAMFDLRGYRDSWVKDLNMQAELIGRAAVPALQFEDRKLAQSNLALLQLRPECLAACVAAG